MDVTAEINEQNATLHIAGELDAVTTEGLLPIVDRVLAQGPRQLLVDLRRLRLIDSRGVGALLHLSQQMRATGGELFVSGAREQPLAILSLLHLDSRWAPRPHNDTSADAGVVGESVQIA